jgi:enterochelin esterase-like enzyme
MSKRLVWGLLVAAALAVAVPTSLAASSGGAGDGWTTPSLLPSTFHLVQVGPEGGTAWLGRIPNRFVPNDHRLSAVYLPPGVSASSRYPVIYLLHGMSGGPTSYIDGMKLAQTADDLISSHVIRPFIAVMPVGGPTVHRDSGEWAGPWESYLVDDVVRWTDEHLPTIPSRAARTLAGLSAGGFGAIDIGLRHPASFSTLESWGGYFTPFHDGPFVGATGTTLAAHTPTLLVREEARRLRSYATRFYLSSGPSHGDITRQATIAFAHEVADLGLSCRLYLVPAGDLYPWRAQLGPGIRAASGASVGDACASAVVR